MLRILNPQAGGIVIPARVGMQLGGVRIDRRGVFIPPAMFDLFPLPPSGGKWDPAGDPSIYPPGGSPGDPVAHLVPNPGETVEVLGPWLDFGATGPLFISFAYNHRGTGCGGATVQNVTSVGFEAENGGGTTGTGLVRVGTQADRPAACGQGSSVFSGVISFQNPQGCQGAPGSATTNVCPGCFSGCVIWAQAFSGAFWSNTGGGPFRIRRVIRSSVPVSLSLVTLTTP